MEVRPLPLLVPPLVLLLLLSRVRVRPGARLPWRQGTQERAQRRTLPAVVPVPRVELLELVRRPVVGRTPAAAHLGRPALASGRTPLAAQLVPAPGARGREQAHLGLRALQGP